MADSCTSCFGMNSVALQRGCFMKKKNILIEYFAALSRFVGLLGQFVTVWKNRIGWTHTQPTTVTLQHMHIEA